MLITANLEMFLKNVMCKWKYPRNIFKLIKTNIFNFDKNKIIFDLKWTTFKKEQQQYWLLLKKNKQIILKYVFCKKNELKNRNIL